MIRVIHGDDEFAVSNALNRHLDALTSPELREANVTVFDAPATKLDEVLDTANIVPFMSDQRAVVVKNMLAPLEARTGRPGKDWQELGKRLAKDGMAIPNVLIFVDYTPLRLSNPNLKPLAAIGEVERYQMPKRRELEKWIRERALEHGLDFDRDGFAKFVAMAGADTRQIDSELRKLALFSDGQQTTARQVAAIVADAHNEGIFRMLDAVIDGNARGALDGLDRLMRNGESIEGVLFLLARQLRTLVLAGDMLARGAAQADIRTRLNINLQWLLEKTLRQASRSGSARLSRMHRRVLEVDLATKTGELDRKLSVELLIADLASR